LRRLAGLPGLASHPTCRVTFIDGALRGLGVVSDAADASHVLVLDAVDAGAAPGALIELDGAGGAWGAAGTHVHQVGIADWVGAVAMLTGRVPRIRVLGVQPANTEWSTDLTPAVRDGLERLVNAAREQVAAWAAE
jgi:hydrogenase maturation protease